MVKAPLAELFVSPESRPMRARTGRQEWLGRGEEFLVYTPLPRTQAEYLRTCIVAFVNIRADKTQRRKMLPRARISSALVLLAAAKSKVARSLPPNRPDPTARPKVAATVRLQVENRDPLEQDLVQRHWVAEI